MPAQDVVIEVLDARMPRASENPVVTEIRGRKPCIKVLSKSDLADPEVTRLWLQYFEARAPRARRDSGEVVAIAITTERAGRDAQAHRRALRQGRRADARPARRLAR